MKRSFSTGRAWLAMLAALLGLAASSAWGSEVCVDLNGNGNTSDPGECMVLDDGPADGGLPEDAHFPGEPPPEVPDPGPGAPVSQ